MEQGAVELRQQKTTGHPEKRVARSLCLLYMKYPSDTELADLTGYTIARIKQLKRLDISCVSIDEPSGGDADGTLLDTLAADVQYEQKEIEHRDCKRQLDELLQKLNPRDRRILELRYGLDGEGSKSLDEVGREMNMTRERIRQIESKALSKLLEMSRKAGLAEYLRN